MRIGSKIVATLVAASSLSLAWSIGNQTVPDLLFPIVPEQPVASGLVPSSASATAPLEPAKNPQANQSPAAIAKPTATSKPVAPAAPVVKVLSSDPINYAYGTVQISLTKTDGKISKIDLIQADASNGRSNAYAPLIQSTIQAQDTKYGNISGATFTTEAFKKAVDNVLAKF